MIENFEVFYKAFLQFSVNTARRIVKDEHIANDIAHNVFSYFFEHQDMLDFSDEEMLMAKVSSKTRKASFDYMKLYEILIRTRVYGETSEEVGKELGMSRNCVNNRNSRATTWMKEKIKKIRRHL